MNFAPTPEQRELTERVLAGARAEIAPAAERRGLDAPLTRQDLVACAELGLLGLSVPAEDGGGGRGLLDSALALEALAEGGGDLGLAFAAAAHLYACCMPIVEFGGERLRARVLPRLCSGEWIGANAITEEGAGSDVYALAASARRDGDHYVIDGAKSFVTNAPLADVFLIYAKTNPDMGFLGISAFVVERDAPGLSVGPPLEKLGLRSTPASAIRLDDCRVPASARLGREGQGGPIFDRSMQWERAGLFSAWTGAMRRQLDDAVRHARRRRQFKRRIGDNQAISHRIADMKLRLEGARLMWQRACWLIDRGEATPLDISMAKLAVSEAAIQSGVDSVRVFGGRGFLRGGAERALRDAVGAAMASGTSEMQREIIARELGL